MTITPQCFSQFKKLRQGYVRWTTKLIDKMSPRTYLNVIIEHAKPFAISLQSFKSPFHLKVFKLPKFLNKLSMINMEVILLRQVLKGQTCTIALGHRV